MSWTCKKCSTNVHEDDLVCSKCAAPKTVWTMAAERTREFVISRQRVEYLRGEGYEAVPAGDPTHDPARVVEADLLYVLDKPTVRAIHERGLLPPSVHVVHVRLYPRKKQDLTVGLCVNYAEAEEEEHELPYEGEPLLSVDGWLDVNLLFVYGEGDLEGVSFEGIHHIVEVGEDTEQGFAPSVEVWALRKKRRELPCELLPPWFEVQVQTTGGEPLAGWRWKLELNGEKREGVLGPDGKLHLDDVAEGQGSFSLLPPEEQPAGEEAEPEAEEPTWVPAEEGPHTFEDDVVATEPGVFRFSV